MNRIMKRLQKTAGNFGVSTTKLNVYKEVKNRCLGDVAAAVADIVESQIASTGTIDFYKDDSLMDVCIELTGDVVTDVCTENGITDDEEINDIWLYVQSALYGEITANMVH